MMADRLMCGPAHERPCTKAYCLHLENHLIGLPSRDDEAGNWHAGLSNAPLGVGEFGDLAEQMARSRHIAQYIHDVGDVLAAGTTHSN